MEISICDSLSDVDVPFETEYNVSLQDDHLAYLHLDLPEIEDAIPETRQRVLKSGQIKQAKRNKKERYAEYANLVTGLGIALCITACSAAPTLYKVHIASFTQRKQRRSSEIGDDYVYDVEFTRETLAKLDRS